MPSYTAEDSVVDRRVEKRSMEITTEERLKKESKAKTITAIAQPDDAAGDEGVKSIAESKLVQFTNSIMKLDETKLSLESVLLAASAADMKAHVPEAALTKAKEAIQLISTGKSLLERLLEAKSASTQERTQLKSVPCRISEAKLHTKKLEQYMKEAAD